jgi:LacI family transcriptional regulator
MRGRVDGLLAISPYAGLDVAAARLPASLPVLLLDSDPNAEAVSTLGVDNHAGALDMMEYLADCGYRDIAFVAGRQPHFNAAERLRGYLDGLARFLPGAEPWVVDGDFDVQTGALAAEALLAAPRRPDCVFAANDMMALGCMFAFQRAGLRVPEDIGLAGFNDIPLAAQTAPPLTSVKIDIARLGTDAFTMLLDRMADGSVAPSRVVRPELMVRGSTRRIGITQ